MARYTPYPQYTLEGTPLSWQKKRLRFALKMNPSKSEIQLKDSDAVSFVPMDAVGEYGGIRLSEEKALADIGSGYTYFCDDDVVVAKITPCFENGKAAIAKGLTNKTAFGTTELHVLRAEPRQLESKFLFYLTISDLFQKLGESEMYGAGGQKRVPETFFKDFRASLPPIEEQQTIARFLDFKTAQIDALIAKQKTLLDKLAEKRTALISHAVTKGLNPSAPMKDSGVAWLGEIPRNWKSISVRWLIRIGSGDFISNTDTEFDYSEEAQIPVVGGNGVMAYSNKSNTNSNCIVIGRVGAHCGNVHFINEPSWVTDNALRVKILSDEVSAEFLIRALKAIGLNDYANKNAQPLITGEMVKSKKIAIPSSTEQDEICKYIDNIESRIVHQTNKIQTAIDRLQEYRAALITNAVTGKIDVQGFQIPQSDESIDLSNGGGS